MPLGRPPWPGEPGGARLKRTVEQYKFRLHWLDGKTEEVTGWGETERKAVADAFRCAGYGGGAIRALDYYEVIDGNPKTDEGSATEG